MCDKCDSCSAAALNGHLECLVCLHEQGYSWDEQCTLNAATNGHLECLRYAHRNGCVWTEECIDAAEEDGDCYMYLLLNGCPYSFAEYQYELLALERKVYETDHPGPSLLGDKLYSV